MADRRELLRRIDGLADSLAAALEAEREDRARQARGVAVELKGVLGAFVESLGGAAPLIDRRTIRHVIAPELERYWERQKRNPAS